MLCSAMCCLFCYSFVYDAAVLTQRPSAMDIRLQLSPPAVASPQGLDTSLAFQCARAATAFDSFTGVDVCPCIYD